MKPSKFAAVTTLVKCLSVSTFLLFNANTQAIEVGNIPATLDVSGGQASYSIPIKVAPGRGGMQPELAITYNSNAGNGVMGMGFNLSGISAITRCHANLAQDGFISGVTFTAKDRYCLDGQRLIPVSGVNGGVGAEYRTEIDSYARIKSYSGSVNNPSYFVVETKAGNKITYGLGNSSAVVFPQGNLSWSISELNDSTGNNPVSYKYFVDQNKQYLDEISYIGGKVEVEYENIDNGELSYFMGEKILSSQRVKSISAYHSHKKLNFYSISYVEEYVSKQYFISKIELCDESNNCTTSNKYHWDLKSFDKFSPVSPFSNYLQGSGSKYLQLDANNDGLLDIVALNHSSSGTSNYSWVALSSSDGTFSKKLTFKNFLQGSGSRYLQLDANGDGLTDIIALNHSSSGRSNYSWVALSNGDGTFNKKSSFKNFLQGSGSKYLQIDVNDDGLLDVVAFNYSSSGTSDYSWVA